jgi:hypothetical protein
MKYAIIILAIGFASCTSSNDKVIDGCQYIETVSYTGNGPVTSLTHKGNCNNPIHRRVDSVSIRTEILMRDSVEEENQ